MHRVGIEVDAFLPAFLGSLLLHAILRLVLNEYTTLTDEAAEILASRQSSLSLNGLMTWHIEAVAVSALGYSLLDARGILSDRLKEPRQ